MPTVCLAMIVKNEAPRIERALRSVLPFIDSYAICDTGSTDDTPAIIQRVMGWERGELVRVPWVNFGHNRSQALKLARTKADYTLVFDADMQMQATGDWRDQLTGADAYDLRYAGALDYVNTLVLANRLEWRYLGSTHEYPQADGSTGTPVEIAGVRVLHHCDGSNRADKFTRDIVLLTDELAHDSTNARAMFYLAQSYRDRGLPHEALHWYTRRARTPGWDEETWYAEYQRAVMLEDTGAPLRECQEAYLNAFRVRPTRIEPIYRLVRLLTRGREYGLATLFSALWRAGFAYPTRDRLFIDAPIYHTLMDEAIAEITRAAQDSPQR